MPWRNGEIGEVMRRARAPVGAADDRDGCGGFLQQLEQRLDRAGIGRFGDAAERAGGRAPRPRRAACPRAAPARPGRAGRRSRRDRRGRHIRGCARASSIRAAHLAIGPKKAGKSTSWKPSRSRSPRATSPMNRIIGVESWKATWTPALALVAPGPRVTKAMPGPPGHLAVGVGHVGDAAFLPADDECRSRACRAARRARRGSFRRDGEDAVAALDPELVDEDPAAGALGHGARR